MVAGAEAALALPRHLGPGPQHLSGPAQKVGEGQLPCLRLGLDAGLHDAHADGVDVVDVPEKGVSSEGVVHQLRVAHRADRNALSVLEVYDVEQPSADEQTVAGAEAAGYPLADVYLLLDEDARAAGKADPQLVEKVRIKVCGAHHFSWIIGLTVQTDRFTENRSYPSGFPVLQTMPQMSFAHLVRPGALCGVLGLVVRQTLGGPGRSGAGQPPGCAGRAQQGVFNRRHLRPPRLSA